MRRSFFQTHDVQSALTSANDCCLKTESIELVENPTTQSDNFNMDITCPDNDL